MKAVQVALLLLCINAGLFIASSATNWGVDDAALGSTPQNVENEIHIENSAANTGGLRGDISDLLLNDKLTLGMIVGGIIIGGASTLVARVTTPKVVGIIAFAGVFSWLLGNLTGIMQVMQMPDNMILVISGLQYFWMVMAVIQMATGVSFEVLQ